VASPERLPWVDAARAFAIIAIVSLHLNQWLMPQTYEAFDDMDAWRRVLSLTGPFRLPVLFALSGFLVADRIRAGWGDRRTVLRAVTSYYLYVIWLAIYALIAVASPGSQPVGVSFAGFFRQLVLPQTPLWFIMFLAINVVILTTLRRVHPAFVLGGAAVVSVLAIRVHLPGEFAMLERGFYCLFFFALGVYGKETLKYFASSPGLWWRTPTMIAISIVSIDLLRRVPAGVPGYLGAIFLRDVSSILCVITVMAVVCRLRPAAAILGYIGRRTLPVYVLHVPLIWALIAIRDQVFGGAVIDVTVVRLLSPALALAFIMGVSFAVYGAARRTSWGRALFDLPEPARQLILRRPAPRPQAASETS
jgi:surface polysaccharide O-acyltransferase-like enzyme